MTLRGKRRRGAGLVENAVIVGLLALFLVGAVSRFREQVDVTIQGTGGTVSRDVSDEMSKPTSPASPGEGSRADQDSVTPDADNPLAGHDKKGRVYVRGQGEPWHRSN